MELYNEIKKGKKEIFKGLDMFLILGWIIFMFILGYKWLLVFGMFFDIVFIYNFWFFNEFFLVCNKYVVYFLSKWKYSIYIVS